MFAPEDVLGRLKKRPFVPLRIVTTTERHEIRNPELVLVGRAFIEIGTPSRRNPGDIRPDHASYSL